MEPQTAAFDSWIHDHFGVPVLDASIFNEKPACISSVVSPARLLNVIHLAYVKELKVYASTNGPTGTDLDECHGSLVDFEHLSTANRRALLLVILKGCMSDEDGGRISRSNKEKIRALPLFSGRNGEAVRLADSPTAYWMRSDSDHTLLEAASQGDPNGHDAPAIVCHEPDLQPLYDQLEIVELTDIQVVRKFILPNLSHMTAAERIEVMDKLAAKWNHYRRDRELLMSLKNTAFVPVWNRDASDAVVMDDLSARRAENVFSWKNSTLLNILKEDMECKYFPPPAMRTDNWHVMMSELGMSQELDNAGLLSIASDIEAVLGTGNKTLAASRGRVLLQYVISKDLAAGIDIPTARSLGQKRFVPVMMPVKVAAGGHVEYTADVTSFNRTMVRDSGVLGFTIMPVLTADISMPLIISSSLGVTTSPTLEIVLQHLKNLISVEGDSLDLWNFPYADIPTTFSAIFGFLGERWAKVPAAEQRSLQNVPLVPIGNTLMMTSRLFFRLTEDLSPFMHEVPRVFGAHEKFLSGTGVKEKPSRDDYVSFLAAFAKDCRGFSLNPNEIKAAVATVGSLISEDREVSAAQALSPKARGRKLHPDPVFVPNEKSCLVNADSCIINDDEWLRTRVGDDLENMGLYFLHSAVGKGTAEALGIPCLSDILEESLVD